MYHRHLQVINEYYKSFRADDDDDDINMEIANKASGVNSDLGRRYNNVHVAQSWREDKQSLSTLFCFSLRLTVVKFRHFICRDK